MHDSDPATTFSYAAGKLGELKISYLHIVEPTTGDHQRLASEALLRQAFGGTLMLNGGYDNESGDAAIGSGAADLVSFGVPFIANPDLVKRYAENASLNTPDQSTMYGGGAEGYTDYPALD